MTKCRRRSRSCSSVSARTARCSPGVSQDEPRAYRKAFRELQESYYDLPRYKGYTADEATNIDALWVEVRNRARSADRGDMLRSLRKLERNGALEGVDETVLKGVRRRVYGSLRQLRDREKFAKQHPAVQIVIGRGTLTPDDVAALETFLAAQELEAA